jgi:N-ethylmaleimide reductase
MSILFSSFQLGRVTLANRAVMAPMTRSRALGNVPNALMATYYGQRASAGLIVTEGTSPSPDGLGYARIPGLYSEAQAEGWRQVTDTVHKKGGHIFVQLMHTGRVGHPHNLPTGARLRAPSALAAPGQMFTDQAGLQAHPLPEAMSEADIERAIEEFVHASALAVERAGFDGVELHGANGYLIEQFLNPGTNQRSDRWGANRLLFATTVAQRVAKRIGGDRLGIRLSPFGANGGMSPFDGIEDFYEALAHELSAAGLAYLHVVDHSSLGAPAVPASIKQRLRSAFSGALILAGGYTDLARAEADLAEKRADLIAFGRPFLANPTLLDKLRSAAPLTAPDFTTLYTPGEKGYTDYV